MPSHPSWPSSSPPALSMPWTSLVPSGPIVVTSGHSPDVKPLVLDPSGWEAGASGGPSWMLSALPCLPRTRLTQRPGEARSREIPWMGALHARGPHVGVGDPAPKDLSWVGHLSLTWGSLPAGRLPLSLLLRSPGHFKWMMMGRVSFKMTQARIPSWRSQLESLPPNGALQPCCTQYDSLLSVTGFPATAPSLGQLRHGCPGLGSSGLTHGDRRSTHVLVHSGGSRTQHMATLSSGKCQSCSPNPADSQCPLTGSEVWEGRLAPGWRACGLLGDCHTGSQINTWLQAHIGRGDIPPGKGSGH